MKAVTLVFVVFGIVELIIAACSKYQISHGATVFERPRIPLTIGIAALLVALLPNIVAIKIGRDAGWQALFVSLAFVLLGYAVVLELQVIRCNERIEGRCYGYDDSSRAPVIRYTYKGHEYFGTTLESYGRNSLKRNFADCKGQKMDIFINIQHPEYFMLTRHHGRGLWAVLTAVFLIAAAVMIGKV